MYTRVAFSLMLIVSVAAATNAGGDRAFEGKWVLDKHASNTSSVPPPGDLRQTIKRKGDGLVIESTFKEPMTAVAPLLYLGIMTTTLQLKADGSDAVNQIGPYMQTSRTTFDGNKMTTEWTAKHTSGDTVNGHWTRTLSDDGKHMTLDIQESSTKGQSGTASLHFVKK